MEGSGLPLPKVETGSGSTATGTTRPDPSPSRISHEAYRVEADNVVADVKRKAAEEPSSPAAAKRIKHDDSAEPEAKPKTAVIPFPEKVCWSITRNCSRCNANPYRTLACCTRGACWRHSIPRCEQRWRQGQLHHPDRSEVHLSEATSEDAQGLYCSPCV